MDASTTRSPCTTCSSNGIDDHHIRLLPHGTAIVDGRCRLSYAGLVAQAGRGLYDTKFRQAPQLETSAEKRERMFLNMSR